MKTVGKAFGFYIKYWQQMEALYANSDKEERDALLEEIAGKEKLVEDVGKCAGEQAARLMQQCGAEIISHFGQFCNVKIRTQPKKIKEYWAIEAKLWPKYGWKSAKTRWIIGLWPYYLNERLTLLIYLWARGGRSAGDKAARILGKERVKRRADELEWNGGNVVFGEVPITFTNRKTFEVDGDFIVSEVRKALKTIRKQDIKQIFKI